MKLFNLGYGDGFLVGCDNFVDVIFYYWKVLIDDMVLSLGDLKGE